MPELTLHEAWDKAKELFGEAEKVVEHAFGHYEAEGHMRLVVHRLELFIAECRSHIPSAVEPVAAVVEVAADAAGEPAVAGAVAEAAAEVEKVAAKPKAAPVKKAPAVKNAPAATAEG